MANVHVGFVYHPEPVRVKQGMRTRIQFSLALLLIIFCVVLLRYDFGDSATLTAYTPEAALASERNSIDIFRAASPSVVFVTNTAIQRNVFSLRAMEVPKGSGSGYIWDKNGYIVTNYHVIHGANRVQITLSDHSTWDAKLVGIAADKDLAVLKIDAPREKLQPLVFGDSNMLDVGQKVLAIGNPFGLDTTLTVGVISALGREIKSVTKRKIGGVIQTDAAINPGNSGGPLLDSSGRLIGVNTAIYSPNGSSVGIGFAIPVNTVKKTVPQLIKYGRVQRPVLGVETATDQWARWNKIQGVVVMRVLNGLPAQQAGMRGLGRNKYGKLLLGDVIVAFDDQAIYNNDELLTMLENRHSGDTVRILVQRAGEKRTVKVTLAAPPGLRP
ncbi:MAG: trypsin-like peptidase domain-containing protein [Pseudomonadales bacterium]|nr:trypsin-like peptidase domain-containing protein [Pseudomonadales bacterium]